MDELQGLQNAVLDLQARALHHEAQAEVFHVFLAKILSLQGEPSPNGLEVTAFLEKAINEKTRRVIADLSDTQPAFATALLESLKRQKILS